MTYRKVNLLLGGFTAGGLQLKRGVPQGSVVSPMLFNIPMASIPTPPSGIHIVIYADDVTILKKRIITNLPRKSPNPCYNSIG